MSASNAVARRDILNFEANVPYELSLRFAKGKPISNGNVMFSTSSDEVFFLKPFEADQLHQMGLLPNELFRLTRRVLGSGEKLLEIKRIEREEPRPEERPAAVATSNTNPGQDLLQPSQAQNNPLSGIMASSYIAAIDALVVAEKYAAAKGVAFRITTGEMRAAAHCIFIAATRQGGR